MYTVRDYGLASWSGENLVSLPGGVDRAPAIVNSPGSTWIVHESIDGGLRTIQAVEIIDSPEPFGRHEIAVVGSQQLELGVFHESGHTWSSWLESPSLLGWSRWDPLTSLWTLPVTAPYDPADPTASQLVIRDLVLGL